MTPNPIPIKTDKVICVDNKVCSSRFIFNKLYDSNNGVIIDEDGNDYHWQSQVLRPDLVKGRLEIIKSFITLKEYRKNKLKKILCSQ